jgi:C4-dicarboxylate-specific signal transduction histidine kinase
MAEAEAQRAREILERIRDFVSKGRIELVPVDLVALASGVVPSARAEAAARGVQIRIEGVGPVMVRADPIQIEQVLVNLISNAIDAAAERRDGIVRICIARHQTTASIVVDDNGLGIAPEIADSLLEPFETTKPRGMGLGLPLSKQIVESHGGKLRWTSLQPQGTRFIVDLTIDGPL